MVKFCIFILSWYQHARVASEKNATYVISFLPFMRTNTALAQIITVAQLCTSHRTFCFGKCKFLQHFHSEDPFSCSLHSPCHLFTLHLFCYTKQNLITFYSTAGFMFFSITPFICQYCFQYVHHANLYYRPLNFPTTIFMLCLSHDKGKLTLWK